MKTDGSIEICGDYKVTVNQASKLDNYSIPKTGNLQAKIGGSQKFTKLDLSHTYQQLLLDEESHKYTTTTQWTIYIQRGYTMTDLLAGITYVIVRLDDILVRGKNDIDD